MILLAGGSAYIASSTIADNDASDGVSCLWSNHGQATIKNTIFARNRPGPNAGPFWLGWWGRSEGYNLLDDSLGFPAQPTDIVNVDPGLDVLADNGGPTWTHALLAGSPAIDAGNPVGCQDRNGAALATDQRGQLRADACSGLCDIGAYERACFPDLRKLYESEAPNGVVAAANDRGLVLASPHDHAPASPALLFYQIADSTGAPAVIHVIRQGSGLQFSF